MLTVQGLSYQRGDTPILLDLNFDLAPSEALIVYGSNGSGKTTLLRLLCGLIKPSLGRVSWNGQSMDELFSDYSESLHYLGHANGMKKELTVCENIQYYLDISGITDQTEIINSILQKLHLSHQKNVLTQHLSAGQKRRLALTRLLSIPRKLWIIDEACAHLDEESQHLFMGLLKEHLQNKGLAILSSHQTITLPDIHCKTLHLKTCHHSGAIDE